MYKWTDKNGNLMFTDDPSKVPEELRQNQPASSPGENNDNQDGQTKQEILPISDGQSSGSNVIQSIISNQTSNHTTITIEASRDIASYTSTRVDEPPYLVVDIGDAALGAFHDKIIVNKSPIIDITLYQLGSTVRFEIALDRPVAARLYQPKHNLVVEFAKPAGRSNADK